MPEISHVRIAIPEQATLNRILREGGAQLFPQWLYAEPGREPQILWWGIRGASGQPEVREGQPSRLLPRAVDDWTEAPRGLVLGTVDAQRAGEELAPIIGAGAWYESGIDATLGARCVRRSLERSLLVLAEPTTEGYVAACLARFGEGPVAIALDGHRSVAAGVVSNPVSDGPATYVRIGSRTAPMLIFLQPR